jgi:hypothetical protein
VTTVGIRRFATTFPLQGAVCRWMQMVKKQVEIEKLLHWAYGDELIKRVTSSAEGIWDRLSQYGSLGGIDPDPGHGGAQRYPHFGLPHPDAEKIEIAVSTLPKTVIDWDVSFSAIMGDLSALFVNVRKMRDVMMVGSVMTAALVTMHGKMKTRPDWRDDHPQPHWVAAERGRNRPKIVGECKGRDRYTIGSYSPLQWEPSPISIAQTRAEYWGWHRGLTILAETIELNEHIALPPSAPAQPWNGEREPPRRIFVVGERPLRETRLPLKPDREITQPQLRPKKSSDVRMIDEEAPPKKFDA